MKKRVLSILLAAIMIVSLVPVTALAADPIEMVCEHAHFYSDEESYSVQLSDDDTSKVMKFSFDTSDKSFEVGKTYTFGEMNQSNTFMSDYSGNWSRFSNCDYKESADQYGNITIEAHATLQSGDVYHITYVGYAITNGTTQDENGSISVDNLHAAENETVTVTVTPNKGYQIKTLKYNDGEDHEITADDKGAYKFTMPAKAVTVTAEFEEKPTYTYEVSFPEGPEQVYIIGDTSNWASFVPMTMTSETTATITVDTQFTGYKYTAGDNWKYVERDAQGSDISNRTTYADPDVVESWADVPPQYRYTTYENWQLKHEGSEWQWTANLVKVDDGLFMLENANWTGSGFNVGSDANPIKKDWFAPEELTIGGDELIASVPVTVDVYLRVIDDETLKIGVGVVPVLTYAITNGTTDTNGSITVAKTAAEGDTVTVTVTPNEGYQLKSLKYNDGTTDYDINKDATTGEYQFTMPAYPVTVTATFREKGDNVNYIDETGTEKTVEAKKLTTTTKEWKDWVYIAENTTIDDTVKLTDNTNLILGDGAKLTVTKGITGNSKTLTVFAQKSGTGELYVTGTNGADTYNDDAGTYWLDDAGNGGLAMENVNLVLHGGKVTAIGGNGGNGGGYRGNGGNGGLGIRGNCDVTGGELIVVGGSSGNSGEYYSAQTGSFAINCGHCTVTGNGKITATGGNGGTSPRGDAAGAKAIVTYSGINGVIVSSTPVSGKNGEKVTVWGHPREIEGKGTKAEPWKIGDSEGDTLTAYLTSGKLVIEGAGNMIDFSADDSFEAPWGTAVTSVEIGEDVTGVGAYAFKGTGLSEVVIPAKVESIGAGAFKDCASLTKVTMQPAHIGDNYAIIPVTLGAGAFDGCTALRTLLVRKGFGDTYKAADNWKSYSDKIVERTDYDIKVLTKDGKTATEGFWYTPSGAVNITKDGLVLTGKTTGERVVACEGVTELTLRDLTIDLDSPNIVCIQKTGDDTLALNIEGTVELYSARSGLYVNEASVTIGGTGSLAVTTTSNSIHVIKGSLTIKDSVSVTATAVNYAAIYGDKDIAISTSGRVDVRSAASSAIATNGDFTIGGTGSVAVTALKVGINAGGSLTIKDSVNITATSGLYSTIWADADITISSSGHIDAYSSGASALGCEGKLILTAAAKNVVAHGFTPGENGFVPGESGALELYSADTVVLPEGWGILGSKDMNAAVKDMKIAAVLHQVPKHDGGLNYYTGYIGTEDFAKSVTFGPVVTLSFPKAEGASYVAKIGDEGMEVFTTESDGVVSFPVAIGTTNVVITTMAEQGYLVKGENPYVINSVNASTKIDSGKLPAVESSKEYLEKLDDALAGNAQSESGVFEVTEKDGVRTVKLLTDLSMTYEDSALTIPAGADVILDLNGHTIDRGLSGMDPADNGNVFINNGKLTIRDSSTAQTGTITGGNATFGGAILSNGDTILEGGTISGCEAYGSDYDTASSRLGRGGAIYVSYTGSFTMTGGEIKDCKANVAGGAIFNVGTVNITGGTISGCSVSGLADGGTVKAKGGAVYNYGYSSFTMTGGKISGNTTGDVDDMRGAGVYAAANANVTLGGTAQIVANLDGAGNASGMFLYDGVKVNISTENPPQAGMSVGITMKTPGQFSTNASAEDAKHFTSDSKEYYISEQGMKTPAAGESVVHVESKIGGVVSSDVQVATEGEPVYLTGIPDAGHRVADMIVKDANGNRVPVTKFTAQNGETVFTFAQPATTVTIEPVFATGGLDLPEETKVTGEEGEKKITSGGSEVEITTSNGVELPETALNEVAAQINTALDNDTVKGFGLTEDETGLDKATEKKDSTIVNSLKAKTTDTTAKDNVSETSISKYLDVKLVAASVNAGIEVTVTAMTFDVTPMATVTVIGEDHEPVTLTAEITNNEIDETVTFLLPVDKTITATTAAVYHEGEFLGNFEIKTDDSGNKYIEVKTDSFSEFSYITLDETTAGAKIGDMLYASLSDAVSKVEDGQTIKLLKDASGTITVSRAVKFTVDANGMTNTATVIAGSGYTVSKSGNTYSITKRSSSGGGVSSYTVKFETNGGNALKNVSVKVGQKIGAIETPKKEGFVFDGWFSDKELTKPFDADDKITKSTTLYANWKVDPVRQIILTIGKKEATVFTEEKVNDVAPKIVNDRTLLPIRFVAEALGATVDWDGEKRLAVISNGDLKIEITIGKDAAFVNGKEVKLDSPAFIENDRTYLPLRFIAENLGAEVEWVEATQQVVITKALPDNSN